MAQRTQQRTAGGIAYRLVHKKIKNINLRIQSDGTVAVSAPLAVPDDRVDAFVASHTAWIRQAQAEAQAKAARAAALPPPDKAVALAEFTRMSDMVYPLFAQVLGGRKPQICVRSMKTRWGVCNRTKRKITLALELYNQPPAAQIYVVVHEYCHFLVPNHSPAFWAEVEKILPDWKARRRLLR